MIVGIDLGASALKIVGIERNRVLFTHAESGRKTEVGVTLGNVLSQNGYRSADVETVALTGVGAEKCVVGKGYSNVVTVSEIEATGEGGTYLAGIDSAVIVSLGTGTAIVLAKDGEYTHIGGSGVGSGTVRGLAKRMMGITDLPEYFSLAEKGDRSKVDLQIRDLFSGMDTLPLDLTASNFAKSSEEAADEDWAAAIINMALEVAGSHAALACSGFGVDTVVITGGLSQTAAAAKCYAGFDRLYPQHFIIPKYSAFATAIGAVRRAEFGA
ncbi:MAG: pantothenate kinase [Clostridiales bacterium]|nr:pantothenate kinase [Clostridiales bacterium]